MESLLIGLAVFFSVLIKNVHLVQTYSWTWRQVGFNSKNKFKWKTVDYKTILCMCGDLDCKNRYMCNHAHDFRNLMTLCLCFRILSLCPKDNTTLVEVSPATKKWIYSFDQLTVTRQDLHADDSARLLRSVCQKGQHVHSRVNIDRKLIFFSPELSILLFHKIE